jgi:hypothetical protein
VEFTIAMKLSGFPQITAILGSPEGIMQSWSVMVCNIAHAPLEHQCNG